MKLTTSQLTNSCLRHALFALAAGWLTLQTAQAHPYASGVTNTVGTINYILNENADNAYVLFDNGTVSNNFGALTKGAQTFALTTHTNFTIGVTKVGSGGPTQISVDTSNTVKFTSAAARGVAVNSNPKDRHFGLIYTLNSTAGGAGLAAKARGIYIFNADTSDAFGRGATASGAVFNSGSSSSPYRVGIGPDQTVYVADFSTVAATVWKFDPDVITPSTWTNVLGIIGENAGIAAGYHADISGKPCVTGSLATGNLVLYTADAALPPIYNSINKYVIGAGPVPWSNAPVQQSCIGLCGIPELNTDMALAPDGKLFGIINRGNTAFDVPSVIVYAADGTTVLWNSITGPGGALFVGPDVCLDGRSIDVSPDGRYVAVLHTDNHITVMALTNGVPDSSTLYTIPNLSSTGNGRQIGWDAADNIYTMSSGQGLLRVISPGSTTTALTGNDSTGTNGTFKLLLPNTSVSVTATTPDASQGNPVPIPGVFTVTRSDLSNDYTAPLSVNFTLTGTATNSTYTVAGASQLTLSTNTTFTTNTLTYTTNIFNGTKITVSNVTLVLGIITNVAVSYSGTVIIRANETSTNLTVTPINDGASRPTTTVVLNVKGGGSYTPKPPVSATIRIANTGPQFVFISAVDAATMYRGYTNDYTSFAITRWGDTNVASYNVSAYTYAGTAAGADYITAPPIALDPGVVTVTNFIYRSAVPPSGSYVGDKSIIVGLGSGAPTYTAGTNTATLTLVDNANPAATVIFSDLLTDANDATNWFVTYGTGDPTNSSANFNVDFGYDLTTDLTTTHGIIALPPSGATNALRITCNKLVNPGAAGGVNVYLTNQVFSGSYVVRFDMNLIEGGNLNFATEGVLFGINHGGSQSNWWYGNGPFPAGGTWGSDGLWYWVSADAGGAGAGDYLEFTGLGGTNNNTGWQQPGSKPYSTYSKVYKIPTLFTSQEGTPLRSGVPANATPLNGFGTTNWSNVEIKQLRTGPTNYVITLAINHTTIFTYTNVTVWTNGYLMLGYNDPFGGTGGTSIGSPDAAAYFSNLKVSALAPPLVTTQPTNLIVGFGSNATYTVAATFDPGAANTNGQWYFNGNPIVGATNTSLSFAVSNANYGTYRWQVNDGTYTVFSADATLRPPMFAILTNPVAGYVVAAGIATNLVSAANSFSGATNYQWQINSANIPGATSRIYSFISGPTNYGTFRVIINDGWNFATSTVAVVTPPLPVIVSVLPATRAAVLGGSASFTATANTFSGLTNYQWLSSSASIPGATNRTLSLANVQAGNFGSLYTVRVFDGTTAITSAPPVTLTLAVSQVITSPALNGTKFSLSFNTEFGPFYVVDAKTNLLDAAWIPVSTNAGTGGSINVTNTISNGSEGYYRIRLQ